MAKQEKYQGWTNYDTWAVKLWMDNDEGMQNFFREMAEEIVSEIEKSDSKAISLKEARQFALADRLKDHFEEEAQGAVEEGLWADLLNSALSEVNWDEIAASLLEDIKG